MGVELQFRDRTTTDPNTFVARRDGGVILITAQFRRTDVGAVMTLTIPAWLDERDRSRPSYDRPLFAIYRHNETTWRIPGVAFAPGDREVIWLVGVPVDVSSEW